MPGHGLLLHRIQRPEAVDEIDRQCEQNNGSRLVQEGNHDIDVR